MPALSGLLNSVLGSLGFFGRRIGLAMEHEMPNIPKLYLKTGAFIFPKISVPKRMPQFFEDWYTLFIHITFKNKMSILYSHICIPSSGGTQTKF